MQATTQAAGERPHDPPWNRAPDPDRRSVELTAERWEHIVTGHPELGDLMDQVLAAVTSPDHRVMGWAPNEEWFYLGDAGPSAWLKVVVVYEGQRGFIVTAHPRRSIP